MALTEWRGFPVAAETRNFLITYGFPLSSGQADPGGASIAAALSSTCESDLSRLQDIFGVDFGVGGRNEHTVWVHVSSPGQGTGASNLGWSRDESSRIAIMGRRSGAVADEYARMLFVAEMAEILMDFSPGFWGAHDSAGEALSRVLAAELHPVGYYGSGDGPGVGAWLASGREDWVSSTNDSDTDAPSFGCGILFINYLRHQLGYTLESVVRTGITLSDVLAGHASLADRFALLAQDDRGWAFPAFAAMLEEHFPAGSGLQPMTDDPFPLRSATARTIGVSSRVRTLSTSRGAASSFTTKPGLLCPEDSYTVWPTTSDVEAVLGATAHGFGAPQFSWTVGGAALPPAASWQKVQVEVTGQVPEPPGTPPGSFGPYRTTIAYRRIDGPLTSSLVLRNADHVSNYALEAVVSASEQSTKSPGVTSATTSVWFDEVGVDVEDRYRADVKRCNPQYSQAGTALSDLVHELQILSSLPDPPPDMRVAAVVQQVRNFEKALREQASAQNVEEDSLRQQLLSAPEVAEALSLQRQVSQTHILSRYSDADASPRPPEDVPAAL